MIKIDKHVRPPMNSATSKEIEALSQMEHGESFLIENCEIKRNNIRGGAKKKGINIITRAEGDKFRIWKISDTV